MANWADMGVWSRFRTHLGPGGRGGDWDTDSGRSHAVPFGGRTLCGVDVGAEVDGWFRSDGIRASLETVDCGRCRRSLEAVDRFGEVRS